MSDRTQRDIPVESLIVSTLTQKDVDLIIKALNRQSILPHDSNNSTVSDVFSIRRLQSTYQDDRILSSIDEFEKNVPLWRQVRGDGNCFYRAFFFCYLEKLLAEGHQADVEKIAENVQQGVLSLKVIDEGSLRYEETRRLYARAELYFIACLRVCARLRGTRAQIANKLRVMMNAIAEFDMGGVLFARAAGLKGLDKEWKSMSDFLTTGECHQVRYRLQQFGYEVDQVQASTIANYLNVVINAQELNKEGNKSWKIQPRPLWNSSSPKMNVNLFYRKGHYDLCYTRDEVEAHYSAQCSAELKAIEEEYLRELRRQQLGLCVLCGKESQSESLRYKSFTCETCYAEYTKETDQKEQNRVSEIRQLVCEISNMLRTQKSWSDSCVGPDQDFRTTTATTNATAITTTEKEKSSPSFFDSLNPFSSKKDESKYKQKYKELKEKFQKMDKLVKQQQSQLENKRLDDSYNQHAKIASQNDQNGTQSSTHSPYGDSGAQRLYADLLAENSSLQQQVKDLKEELHNSNQLNADLIEKMQSSERKDDGGDADGTREAQNSTQQVLPNLIEALKRMQEVQDHFKFLAAYQYTAASMPVTNQERKFYEDRLLQLKTRLKEKDEKINKIEEELRSKQILLQSYEKNSTDQFQCTRACCTQRAQGSNTLEYYRKTSSGHR